MTEPREGTWTDADFLRETEGYLAEVVAERDQLREDNAKLRKRKNAPLMEMAVEHDQLRERAKHLDGELHRVAAQNDKLWAERDQLRELAVRCYRAWPVDIARMCDEQIDPSGRLLGEVRKAARNETPATSSPDRQADSG